MEPSNPKNHEELLHLYASSVFPLFLPYLIPVFGQNLDIKDQALLDLVAEDAEIEKLADGFRFTEGPVWNKEEGYLLFSDIPANTIYQMEAWRAGKRF